MVIVELFRFPDSEIQQLHLYIALDPSEILYKVISASEQTTKFFTFPVRHYDTLQSVILQLSRYQLRIYLIGLGMFLFALSMNVCRIDYQTSLTVTLKTTMSVVTATTSFISYGNFILLEMF